MPNVLNELNKYCFISDEIHHKENMRLKCITIAVNNKFMDLWAHTEVDELDIWDLNMDYLYDVVDQLEDELLGKILENSTSELILG